MSDPTQEAFREFEREVKEKLDEALQAFEDQARDRQRYAELVTRIIDRLTEDQEDASRPAEVRRYIAELAPWLSLQCQGLGLVQADGRDS